MTLVIGYASPEFAVMVADRMITWPGRLDHGGHQGAATFNEPTTKVTLVGGQYLVGYSGVADLGGETEVWLLERLSELTSPEERAAWPRHLADAAGAELQRFNRGGSASWISFLVVGFDRPIGGEAVPGLHVISNGRHLHVLGAARAAAKFRKFKLESPTVRVPGEDFRLWAIGSVPHSSVFRDAVGAIRSYRRRYPGHCREIIRVLARLVVARSVELAGKGVGAAVQAAVLPESAQGQSGVAMGELRDPLTEAMAWEFNAGHIVNGEPVMHGINIVESGFAARGPAVQLNPKGFIGPPERFGPPG